MARLDPRWRLAALAMAALALAGVRTLPAAAAGLAGTALLAALARVPPGWLLARLGALAGFLALFALPLPLLIEGGPSWQVGPLHFSARGAAAAGLLVVKVLSVATVALVALAAGPLDASLKAAHALRVPGLVVQMGLLSYRYAFVLADELRRLRVALRVRGFRSRPTSHAYRTLGHVAGAVLVRGHERAERVGQAMRCRGFDGRFRSLASFRTTPADVLAFALLAGGSAVLCVWSWLGG
jgi:cobalt/nickel transport system permease protein